MRKMPKQLSAQQIGKIGERRFLNILPATWNTYKPESDLGADYFVEIWTEGCDPRPTSVRFAAQVKCHESYDDRHSDETDYLSGEVFKPCVEYERIRVSTLSYLHNQNGQLFSLFLSSSYAYGLTNLATLFDSDSHIILDLRLREGSLLRAEQLLFFVSNLKAIGDLLFECETEKLGQSVNIPLLPQNSNIDISNFSSLSRRNYEMKYRQSEAYLEAEYDVRKADYPELLIFPLSWKSKLFTSLTSRRFETIEKIRYVAFLPLKDKAGILSRFMTENKSDISTVVEILISVAHCRPSKEYGWIANLFSRENASLNFLILRCVRVHNIQIEKEGLSTYLSCAEGSTGWFHTHFFDGQCGKAFLRRYYDEVLYHFHDQIECGHLGHVNQLFEHLITTKPPGTFSLFGQLTDGKKPTSILNLAMEAICRVSGIPKPTSVDSQSLIGLAYSIDIYCYDL